MTICCHLGLETAEISSVLPDPCNNARHDMFYDHLNQAMREMAEKYEVGVKQHCITLLLARFLHVQNQRKAVGCLCGKTSLMVSDVSLLLGKHQRKICLQSSLDQSDINLPKVYMQFSNNSSFFQQLVEDLGFELV